MMWQSLHSLLWKSWRRSRAHGGGDAGPRRQKPARRFRPQLEFLEDRTLLSTFTVNNLNDSGPGSLREAIGFANASPPGSTINFLPGMTGTIKLTTGTLGIFQAMEIDGPGASVITVSGQNLTTVFEVSSFGIVTINDLTIANGKGTLFGFGEGGGIWDDSNLNLSGVTFANNRASSEGGAIFTEFAAVTVTNCTFSGNRVVAPTGAQFGVGGGAIFSLESLPLTVTGTKFMNNSVVGANRVSAAFADENLGLADGGAVFTDFDFAGDVFTGCTFTGNSALGGREDFGGSGAYTIGDGQGGAIEVAGDSVVEVDQSTFSSNIAQGGIGIDGAGGGRIGMGLGGAIHVQNSGQLTVTGSTFSGNRALGANFGFGASGTLMNEGDGGAIDDEGSATFLTVTGSTFSGNTAKSGISGFSTSGFLGLIGSGSVGGAINLGLSASGDISGTFIGNAAIAGSGTGNGSGGEALGGAIDTFPTNVSISNSQFKNNRAQGGLGGPSGGSGGGSEGGGLFGEGGNITLLDLLFSSNQAIAGAGQGTGASGGFSFGGAMSLLFANVSADTLTVKSNVAQGGAGLSGANGGWGFGGGIEAFDNVACTIADSLVTLNKALGGVASGGGSNGLGFGGGISHAGALNLPFTTIVTANFASTADPNIL